MKRIPPATVQAYIDKLVAVASQTAGDSDEWRAWHALFSRPARVLLPLGELANPAMAGFVRGWFLDGRLPALRHIAGDEQLGTQGIGRYVEVDTLLVTALLAARESGMYGISVWADTDGLPAVRVSKSEQEGDDDAT